MCGIAGILKIHDPEAGPPPPPLEAIPEAWLDVLDDSILHRGPDGQGRFRDRAVRADGVVVDVAFVHRRLSIIDHAGGHQPMVHDGERLRADLTYARGETPKLAHELCPASECPDLVAVVFNGCIYNHRDLRAELEGLGHRFETDHSDTEVLVHGWRAWNEELPLRCDGMFALLAWGRRTPSFAAARDWAGEKPLYDSAGCVGGNAYCFTTAATGITRMHRLQIVTTDAEPPDFIGIPGGIDTRYFEPWITHGAGTGTAGWCDEEVEPAGVQSLRLTEPWYKPIDWDVDDAFFGVEAISNEAQHLCGPFMYEGRTGPTPSHELVDAMIRRAVESRLEADTDVGLLLSAGLDSGMIAAHLRDLDSPVCAITVRMPELTYDESAGARETAEHLGIRHTIVDVAANPASDLEQLICGLGLPFGDSSLLPTYWAFKAAREHAKVVLTGDGADELFAGYERYLVAHMSRLMRFGAGFIPSPLLDQRDPKSRSSKLARLGRAARHGGYDDLVRIFESVHMPELWNDHRRPFGTRISLPTFERFFPSWSGRDAAQNDFTSYLPDDLLRKTDTASMAVPVEARAPFLSRELVRECLKIPFSDLVRHGRKGLLKQVARKYLPDHIVDRPKQGFAIPVGDWFRTDYGNMRTLLYDHLESADPFPGLGDAGVEINMEFVRKMLREHDAAGEKSINPWHGRDHSQRLYMVLVLSIWAKWLAGVRAEAGDAPGA